MANFAEMSVTGSISFTDMSTQNPTQWAWDFGDGNTSTLQNPTHAYSVTQQYNVCLTATSVCGSNTFCKVVSATAPTAVDDIAAFSGLSVYPNPASGQFTVECVLQRPVAVSLSLTDVLGKQVLAETVAPRGLALARTVDLKGLPAGVYMLELVQGNSRLVKKVVVQ